jgi:hypothetical protein
MLDDRKYDPLPGGPGPDPPKPPKDEDGELISPVPDEAPPPNFILYGRKPSFVWRYLNALGQTLHFTARYEPRQPGDDKDIYPFTYRLLLNGKKRWKTKGYPRDLSLPIYGLNLLAAHPNAIVVIVEGEKCADAANALFRSAGVDAVAISLMGGAKSLDRADLEPLRGRKIIIWRDNDTPGETFCRELANKLLNGLGCAVSRVDVDAIIAKHGAGLKLEGLDVADLPPSAELAADALALTIPCEIEPDDDLLPVGRPGLFIDKVNPDGVVEATLKLLVEHGELFRSGEGKLVRLDRAPVTKATFSIEIDHNGLPIVVHRVCRPYVIRKAGTGFVEIPCPFPVALAKALINFYGSSSFKRLRGICRSPKLTADGSIDGSCHYDDRLQVFFEGGLEDIVARVPANPTDEEVKVVFLRCRERVRTFPFSDSPRLKEGEIEIVDLSQDPGLDESVFHNSMSAAIMRASVDGFVPWLLIRGARDSGSGSGKGKAAECIIVVAFRRDTPNTWAKNTGTEGEFDKTFSTALREFPDHWLADNLNGMLINSGLLESSNSQRGGRARVLSTSTGMALDAAVYVIVTGNALTIVGDGARRFVDMFFDAHCEFPRLRKFSSDVVAEFQRDRDQILVDYLTIWRWGVQNADRLTRGAPSGSFPQWERWARDPLMALGCRDVVETMSRGMADNPMRESDVRILRTWWSYHRDDKITVSQIRPEVLAEFGKNCTARSAMFYLRPKVNQRIGGFVLRREDYEGAGHTPSKYWLELTVEESEELKREDKSKVNPTQPQSGVQQPDAPPAEPMSPNWERE